MYIPNAQHVLEHWSDTPELLRDAISSPTTLDTIDSIGKAHHLDENKQHIIERLSRGVFLGLIHLEDLHKELQGSLGIDGKLALEIYHELDKKILSSFRKNIEQNYLTQKSGETQEVEEMPKGDAQVILKKEAPTTLNLRKKYGVDAELGQAPPLKVSADTLKLSVKRDEKPGTPTPVSLPVTAQPTPAQPAVQGPVMLHKREEAESIVKKRPAAAYRQTSFGGFGGSFRTPFAKKIKPSATKVEIEMPTNQKQEEEKVSKVPVSVKRYDQAKTVHYAALKTDVSGLSPKTTEPATGKTEKLEENGMVDLSQTMPH